MAGRPGTAGDAGLAQRIAAAAEPLPSLDDPGFGALFDRWADRRVVLLGEASHGTSEFYRGRAAITRRLIEHHGFTIVAVEADWPDAAAIDRYVRGRARSDGGGEPPFQRFPTWMWRNTDVAALVGWMRDHNAAIPEMSERAGFYGLDMYNLGASLTAVLEYLEGVDPNAAAEARERYGCIAPWRKEPSHYGRAVLSGYDQCEAAVVEQCRELLGRRMDYAPGDADSFLDAAANARLIASAERYYRVMYYGGAESWNLRDTHMFDTLRQVMDTHGPDSRAVVWAHNSHIGDARHTEMGQLRGELNLGQLCRQHWGEAAALIGFGTHTGTVAAASDWDGEMEIKPVRPSRPGSHERVCHDAADAAGTANFLLDLRRDPALRAVLTEPRLERFIGVIYRPDTELMSHYAEAVLPEQFDAWVWFDETTAVTPLGPEHRTPGLPDTYPFGL
jgi:erythromycin esterase-like protein